MNAADAYSRTHPRAGAKTAKVEGCRILAKPNLQDWLQAHYDKETEKAHADLDELRAFWTKLVRGQIEGAEIQHRLKASELMGRSLRAFVIAPSP